MTTPATGRSLHHKLAAVMGAVGYIPKNGQGPGYRFAAASDVADRVREELAKARVTFLPVAVEETSPQGATTLSGKQSLVTLRVTWRITDADTGETVEVQSEGTGADNTDKAVPKALTNALKYAFLMSFAIPTGDDPEASAHQDEEPHRPRRRTIEYPALSPEELHAIAAHLRAVVGAPDEAALRDAGVAIGADTSLSEAQRAYLQASYVEARAKLRTTDVA